MADIFDVAKKKYDTSRTTPIKEKEVPQKKVPIDKEPKEKVLVKPKKVFEKAKTVQDFTQKVNNSLAIEQSAKNSKFKQFLSEEAASSVGKTLGAALGGPLFGPIASVAGGYFGKKVGTEISESDAIESFNEGLKSSSGAILAKAFSKYIDDPREFKDKDRNYINLLSRAMGEGLGDTPAIALSSVLGAKGGAIVGAAIGSVIPGAGSAGGATVGGLIGGASVGLAVNELIKKSYEEYRDFVKQGNDLTFEEFLKRAGRVGSATAKSAVLGAVLGTTSKLLPYLKKIPGIAKMVSTKPGKALIDTTAKAAALTGTDAIYEGKMPTGESFAHNAVSLLGYEMGAAPYGAIHKGFRALKEYENRPLELTSKAKPEPALEAIKKVVPESVKKFIEKKQEATKYIDLVKDYTGEIDVKKIENQEKWVNEYKKALTENGKLFTEKEHQDMFAYANKTGNPNIENDGYNDVVERLPKAAKNLIDKAVRPAFKRVKEEVNSDPLMKDINERPELMDRYLPGMYEGSAEEIQKASTKIKARFNTNNPHASFKTFLNYHNAMKEAGLKPKYKTIPQLLEAYMNNVARAKMNASFLREVRYMQDVTGKPLLKIAEKDKGGYIEAKNKGFTPFWDEALRTYRDKDGNVKISPSPALLEPGLGDMSRGIFSQRAPIPAWKSLESYDKLKSKWQRFRVSFSPYHYFTQTWNLGAFLGVKKGILGFPTVMREGGDLLKDIDFKKRMARARVITKPHELIDINKIDADFTSSFDDMVGAKNESMFSKAKNKLINAANALHQVVIPRMKAYSFNEITKIERAKIEKQTGKPLTAQESKALDRLVATNVNNTFGGTDMRTSLVLNDPLAQRSFNRIVSFPQWTLSNLRQAMDAIKPGLAGKIGKNAVARMALQGIMFNGAMRFISGALRQTEDGSTLIDPIAGYNEFRSPTKMDDYFRFTYPAFDVRDKTGKIAFRIGRNPDGTRMQITPNKQLLEVYKYFQGIPEFTEQVFNKLAEPIKAVYKQLAGHTPSALNKTLMYPVQAKYEGGEKLPWQGKKGLIAQLPSRGLALADDVFPYGPARIVSHGLWPWAQTLFGSFSSRKETTLSRESDNIREALETGNNKQLDHVRALLKRNDFTEKQINSAISRVKGVIKKDRYSDLVRGVLLLKHDKDKMRELTRLKHKVMKDPLGFSKQSFNGLIQSGINNLAFNGFMTKAEGEKLFLKLKNI